MAYFETHNFYCMNCGKPTIPVMRKMGQMHKKFHRKKLYCPHCKIEVNCIECRNDEEAWEFKQRFEDGEFIEEAANSILYIEEEKGASNE